SACLVLNDAAIPAISPLSLHVALPISPGRGLTGVSFVVPPLLLRAKVVHTHRETVTCGAREPLFAYVKALFHAQMPDSPWKWMRSEEHTSELQSRENLVCRLLLEKKNT